MVDINQVIETVNKLRVALELEAIADLPEGEQLQSSWCPIAKALNNEEKFRIAIGTDELCAQEMLSASIDDIVQNTWGERTNSKTAIVFEHQRYKNPQIITDFINEFDRGLWPQYLEEENTDDLS